MKRGYIKLWRKSKESPVFANEGLWKLWCLCLMKATHKEIDVTISGILKPVKLNPGQFITGRYSLHYDYHQGEKKNYSRKATPTAYTLIRWLKTLQHLQMLSIKTFNKYSIITICNWELYQQNEHQVSNRRASSEHKQEQYKNNKEKLSMDLYESYLKEISPINKSRQRAISNITSHLKKYQYEKLTSAIKNYKSVCIERNPIYRKDPANFFGKREHFFVDFLPENFKVSDCDQALVQPKKQPTIEELLSND